MSEQSDWEKLSREQQSAVDAWRQRVSDMLDREREQFERNNPELRLNYSFISEPLIRADHPVIMEEL